MDKIGAFAFLLGMKCSELQRKGVKVEDVKKKYPELAECIGTFMKTGGNIASVPPMTIYKAMSQIMNV